MGLCGSKGPTEEEKHLQDSDRAMDKALRAMTEKETKVVKLLLLGTGESGKSTIFKQMQVLYEETGFNEQEKASFASVIRHNVVESMQVLLTAVAKFMELEPNNYAYRYSSDQVAAGATFILQLDPLASNFWTADIAPWIKFLWSENCVQAAYARRSELQLIDSAAYFFQHVERIASEPFNPTTEDILRARLRTSGIVERQFKIHGVDFKFMDVGGQRNERRKWIHCFEDVTAIIFVTAVSEYDQNLYEDEKQNRLRESFNVFQQIVNNKIFRKSTVILFLNKVDLFEDKIKRVPLNRTFPEYSGPEGDAKAAADFIKEQFKNLIQDKNKIVEMHTTCATDTENVKRIFEACKKTILEASLRDIQNG